MSGCHEHLHNPRALLFKHIATGNPYMYKSFTVVKQHGRRHQEALCHRPTLHGNPPVAELVPALQVRGMTEVL